jgi:uncharacterized membrane protein
MGFARNTEDSMKKAFWSFLAASAVMLFAGRAGAEENALLALNTKAPPAAAITTELQAQATAQIRAEGIEPNDFDALSEVNDPLYRESSKEFLQQVSKDDAAKPADKAQAKPALRDAPNSQVPAAVKPVQEKPAVPAAVISKPRTKAPPPLDPVKAKNTL